ncbi:MAG: hypothetical protein K0S39_6099 [Paenibacillus sp.]|nr:hypothetical protein [Paenibacillus sp.]
MVNELKIAKSYRVNDVKESNRINILRLFRSKTISRVETASMLGLSKSAVSTIVDELINEGLLIENGYGISGETGGKRPILLELNKDAGMIIALDFNDRSYEIALTNLASEVVKQVKKKTNIFEEYQKTFDEVLENIRNLIQEVRFKGNKSPILACGITLKGLVNTSLGTLQYSSGIPGWKDIKVRDYLSNALNIPVFIENDARAITMAQMLSDRRDNAEDAITVCVNVNFGIGTGVAIKNEIYRGAHDGAVTFAHTLINDNGPLCRCGNQGCWESLASDWALLKELAKLDSKYEPLDIPDVIKLFHEGNEQVREVILNHTGYWLGAGISNILNTFNPDYLILQGDITQTGNELLQKIQEVALKRALPVNRKANISFSKLSGDIRLKGAAAVALHQFFSKEYHFEMWSRSGR